VPVPPYPFNAVLKVPPPPDVPVLPTRSASVLKNAPPPPPLPALVPLKLEPVPLLPTLLELLPPTPPAPQVTV